MLDSLLSHYEEIIPLLKNDFTKLYKTANDTLSPVDKRLVVIKLLHFKNELVTERRQINYNKSNPTQQQQHPNEQHRPRGGQPNQQEWPNEPQENYREPQEAEEEEEDKRDPSPETENTI
jgi:hypothetical protein